MFRVNGKPAIGLAIAMRDGGDILALGRNVKKAIDESVANLPLGIDATLVSDQPVVVQTAIGEFMESLWQAIAIIMAVSIISLGLRPGSVVALTIPLTIAIVFPIMEAMHIDLQRISLGALIISLEPAGRQRHDHHRRHDDAPRRRATARRRRRPSPIRRWRCRC